MFTTFSISNCVLPFFCSLLFFHTYKYAALDCMGSESSGKKKKNPTNIPVVTGI
jgi:hypothetical protein